MDMQDELIDRFGDIPKPVENLLLVAQIKAMAHQAGVTEVNINRQEITLRMYKNAGIDTTGIPGLIDRYKGAFVFRTGEVPTFIYQDRRAKNKDCTAMIEKAEEILGELGRMAVKASV